MNRWIQGIAGALILLVILGVTLQFRAASVNRQAEVALTASDPERAIKYFFRGLAWYLPFGAPQRSAERLCELGLQWHGEGRDELAFKALTRMRSGLYAARWLYVPRRDLIAKAEPVLADILAYRKLGPKADAAALAGESERYLRKMARPTRPGLAPSLAVSLGFVAWTGSVLAMLLAPAGIGRRRRIRVFLPILVLGLIFWVWGMTAA